MKFRETISQNFEEIYNSKTWSTTTRKRETYCESYKLSRYYISLMNLISKNREAFGTVCLFTWRPAKDHGFLAGGIVFPLTCTRWPAFLSGPHPDFDLVMIQLKAVTRFHNNTEKGCREAQVKQ